MRRNGTAKRYDDASIKSYTRLNRFGHSDGFFSILFSCSTTIQYVMCTVLCRDELSRAEQSCVVLCGCVKESGFKANITKQNRKKATHVS